MNKILFDRMKKNPDIFSAGKFGLEKENLRVKVDGTMDQSNHPVTPKDPFYRNIIKDFAESQVEFVTEPKDNPSDALKEIMKLQDHFIQTYDVRLWPFSMPCRIKEGEDIRIAEFDASEEGKAARAYREMLSARHGKKMQLISGVHYNFSFSDRFVGLYQSVHLLEALNPEKVKNQLYFHVARNLLRYKWLLIYLFGASPFVDASYKEEVTDQLKSVECWCACCNDAHTYYETYATSLRMSRYGYHNKLQEEMSVSYNQLEEYIEHMRNGIDKGILQKESEYYAPIRFKNSHGIKGSMLDALEAEGVEYLELRLFDLNPYKPYGITEEQMYLTHLFLIYSAIKSSPHISSEELNRIYANGQLVSLFGRKSDKEVFYRGKYRSIEALGKEVLEEIREIAEILDKGDQQGAYSKAITCAETVLSDQSQLLSARLTKELLEDGLSYIGQGIRHSIYDKTEVLI